MHFRFESKHLKGRKMKIFGILFVVAALTACGGDGGNGDVLGSTNSTTMEEPNLEQPNLEEPTAAEPATEAPTTEEPTTEEPTTEEPTTEEPLPEKWTIVSEIPFDWEVYKTFIDADHVYVAESFGGATIIDASNVAKPEVVWNSGLEPFGGRDNFYDVIVTGNLAVFIAYANCRGWCSGTFPSIARIYEKTNPAEPVLMDSFTLNSSSLAANENLLFAAISDEFDYAEIRIFDLSDPGSANIIGSVDINVAGQLAVVGQIAYVAYNDLQNFDGIDAVNIADTANPVVLGDQNKFRVGNVRHSPVALAGNIAYIADQNKGVQVVDITDPLNMQLVVSVPTTSDARDVAVAGGYLYVAQGVDGVAVYDIDVPTDPKFIQYIDTPAPALSISVSERIGVVSIDEIRDSEDGYTGSLVERNKLLLFLTD